jgi:hypothetical protein
MGGDTWGSEFLWQGGDVQVNYLSSQNFMNYLNCTLEGRYRQLPGKLPDNRIYRGSGVIYPITR